MLFGEMSDVCSENHMTCINTLCGQNAQFLTGTKYQQTGFKVCVCVWLGGRRRLTLDSSLLNARLKADSGVPMGGEVWGIQTPPPQILKALQNRIKTQPDL